MLFLQYKVYKTTKCIPYELKDNLKKETFEKSRLYEMDKSKLGFMSGIYSQIEATVSEIEYFNVKRFAITFYNIILFLFVVLVLYIYYHYINYIYHLIQTKGMLAKV